MSVRSRERRARAAALAAAAGVALLAAAAASASAQVDPAGAQVVQQMRKALEPDKPSVRQMTLTVSADDGTETSFQLVQARKRLADGRRSLTVLVEPPDARGLAYLVVEQKGQIVPVEYLYVPMVRRVRKLVGSENQTAFLDSDFTYADLGFLPMDTQDRLVGEEKIDGRDVFKIESTPSAETKTWYYSKVVTWVDKSTLLPVQRDFYSPANQVFKIQTFGETTRIDGLPTILETEMENVGAGKKSRLRVTNIAYGSDLPDELFSPDRLSKIADAVEKIPIPEAKK